jgi:large repetitive protein
LQNPTAFARLSSYFFRGGKILIAKYICLYQEGEHILLEEIRFMNVFFCLFPAFLKRSKSTALISLLTFLLVAVIGTPSYADLGLDSSDFGSQPASGKKVSGAKLPTDTQGQASGDTKKTNSANDGSSEDTPGQQGPFCRLNTGTENAEGPICKNGQCNKVSSFVNLFTRQYQDDIVDMSVKTVGGFIKLYRVHTDGKWQLEHDLHRLDIGKIQTGQIMKAGLTYKQGSDGLFHYKTFTITHTGDQFRWEDKTGDYILYDKTGRLMEAGSRLGTLARYTYQGEKLITISDRMGTPVYHFTYEGQVIKVNDTHDRQVTYTWDKTKLLTVTDVLGHTTRYSYSPEDRLIAKSDETGRKFFITYHPDGAVQSVLSRDGGGHYFSFKHREGDFYAKVTTTMGQVKEYWYDADGETDRIRVNGQKIKEESRSPGKATTTDELGNQIIKTYDDRDNLLSEEFVDGTTVTSSYDSKNNLISTINELGIESRFSYNEKGLPIKIMAAYKTADQQVTDHNYDLNGNRISTTTYQDQKPLVTTFTYDAADNRTSVTDPLGGKQQYQYDYMGNVVMAIDPAGLTTRMEYDKKGNLVKIISPDNQSRSFAYDAAGRQISVTTINGTTTSTYDFQDNLVKVEDPLGGITKYSYDKDNRLTKKLDEEGRYTVYFYDPTSDKVSKIIDGNGNKIQITYRGYADCGTCSKTFIDKPVRIEFPTFIRQYKYDFRGRVLEQNDYHQAKKISTESYQYDKGGRLIATTDRNGQVTRREYDNLNRLVKITDPADGITRFAYDGQGNLIQLTDAKNQTTRFVYDALGHKTQEVRPLGNSLEYKYDLAGRLLQRTDSLGQQVKYLYDDKTGRLESYLLKKGPEDFPGEAVRFSYDNQGNLAGYQDATTKAHYEYDKLGRRIKESVDYGTFSASHSYSYYQNGLKKSYTGPDGLIQNYTYNLINKLEKISIDSVGDVVFDGYKWLRPEKIHFPGIKKADRYDEFLRLAERKTTTESGQPVLDLSYRYDPTDNIISRTSAGVTTSYTYDNLQRLIGLQKNGDSEKFAYDPVGNRLLSNREQNYLYDANNQLLAVGDTRYIYDRNGSTLSQTKNNDTTTFQYTLENRLSQVKKNGLEARYSYDPFGRRLSKEVNGKRTWFYYTDEGLVAEFDAKGKLTTSYSYQPDSLWSTDPVMMSEAGKHYFYHNDHLGAPQRLTDKDGAIVWQAAYDAFGGVTIEKEVVKNRLRLPGQFFDEETGLYYNWHRYYSPETGRYVSADPVGLEGGLNLFAYAGGDPVNWIDYTGLFGCNPDGSVNTNSEGDANRSANEKAGAWAQYQYEQGNIDYKYSANYAGGADSWKCNVFVRDALQKGGGLDNSKIPKHYNNGKKTKWFARANEIADLNLNQDVLDPVKGSLQPGDLVAWPNSDTGHVGIVGCDGRIYNARKDGIDSFNQKWGWANIRYRAIGRSPVYRRPRQ